MKKQKPIKTKPSKLRKWWDNSVIKMVGKAIGEIVKL